MIKDFYNSIVLRGFKKEVKKIRKINLSNLSQEEIINLFTAEKNKNKPDRRMIFAIISEAFKRTININIYDEQLMGGLALDEGYISEMKTGEGKTFVSVFPSIMSALYGKAYNVTVNDYLAKRDYEKTKPIYDFIGIKSSFNEPLYIDYNDEKKKKIYEASVIYTSGSEFVFDYLRDDTLFSLDTAIVDEIDFVLIDNANSKFSVSQGGYAYVDTEYVRVYEIAKELFKGFVGGYIKNKQEGVVNENRYDVDYIYSPHNRNCSLTLRGMEKVEKIFKLSSIQDFSLLYKAILHTIEANMITVKNKDYIVQDDKIVLINRENGRLMPDSQKGEGLQTAIELKENVKVTAHDDANNSISYQLFFSKFKKLVGMSGTVMEASSEFKSLFNTESIVIPTHRTNKRIDYPDRFFKTKKEKYEFLKELIKKIHSPLRPILIITESEDESIYVHNIIKELGYDSKILNALNCKEEEDIVKNAGNAGVITVSTNMSGRGTDIVLDETSKKNGGLFVICLNKYESKRVDNQARGRAGRQGQAGGCLFLSSFEDKIFTHLEKKIYEKFINMSDDEFYDKKTQSKLAIVVDNLQRYINGNLEAHRKAMFKSECVEDSSKTYLIEKAREEYLNAINLVDLIMNKVNKEYDSLLECKDTLDDKKILFFYEQLDLEQELDKEAISDSIRKKVETKVEQLGDDISRKLMVSIIKELIRQNWHFVRKQFEEYSNIYNLNSDVNGEQYAKYIIETKKIVDGFDCYINVKAIELYLIAERK